MSLHPTNLPFCLPLLLLFFLFPYGYSSDAPGLPGHSISAQPPSSESTEESWRQIPEEEPGEYLTRAVDHWYEGKTNTSISMLTDLRSELNRSEHGPIYRAAQDSLVALLRETGSYRDALDLIDAPRVDLLYLDGRPEEAIEVFESLDSTADWRSTFFAARAYAKTGQYEPAVELAQQTLSQSPYTPAAWHLKGVAYFRQGNYEDAVAALERARAQEPNLTDTLVLQGHAHIELGEYAQAREMLIRAHRARPHDERAGELLSEVEDRAPHLAAVEEHEEEVRRQATTAPTVGTYPVNREQIPRVRVGLADSLQGLWLKSGSDWHIEAIEGPQSEAQATGPPMLSGNSEELVRIEYQTGSLNISVDDEREFTHDLSDGWIRLRITDETATTVLFDLEHSRGQFSAGSEDRAYRGALRFGPSSASGFAAVNTVDLESYLYSVVPSEMPASWPAAALEAQAVAARSYTLAHAGRFERHGYDVSGSVRSAFYRGYSGEHPRSTAAVDDTRGMVLVNDDGVVPAYYSANNAGHTDTPEDVWGGGKETGLGSAVDPHLEWNGDRRRPDELWQWLFEYPESYSAMQPFASRNAYRWELWVEADEIRARLEGNAGEIHALEILGRTPAGRVRTVRLATEYGERRLSGDEVRRRLGGLRSNLFIVNPVYAEDSGTRESETRVIEAFHFRGGGWGHGVGMDQTGAAGYAASGANFREILSHYYPGTVLERTY